MSDRSRLLLFFTLAYASSGISLPGDGEVDQQSSPPSGRLVGELDDRRNYMLNLPLVWDR